MQDLRLALIQGPLHWHEIDANLSAFEEKIWIIENNPDVIVLPEMFSTGFTMEADKLAEPANSRTFRWMSQMAQQTGAMIIGSFQTRLREPPWAWPMKTTAFSASTAW